jgi:hypothetical protein
MGPVNHGFLIFQQEILVVKIEGLIRSGLMNTGVGLSTVSLQTKHIVFVVSYSDAAIIKKQVIQHLWWMVGVVGTKKLG